MTSLLRRHPAVRRGWLVRGAGCAGWWTLTLGLAVLGTRAGHGLVLATVGLSAYSASSVVGGLLGLRVVGTARPALVNAAAWAVAGLGWVVVAARPDPVVVAVIAVLLGLAVPPGNAAVAALVVTSTRGEDRRAALTLQSTVVSGCTSLGSLAGGPLMVLLGPRPAVAATGVAVLGVAGWVAVRDVAAPAGPRTCPDGRAAGYGAA